MVSLGTAAILLACLCLAFAAPIEEDVPSPVTFADEDYRLPTIISPVNYKINLQPYLLESDGARRFTFDGEVEIEITTSVTTRQLVLHSRNLNYTLRQYWNKNNANQKITLSNPSSNQITNKDTYSLTADLVPGSTYVLHFTYVGSMDDDMHGFYRSSYTDSKNRTKWLASTQFEPNHARRVFPSFDEPQFKATFDISIVRHKTLKTVGNTRLSSSLLSGDWITDVYTRSPKMSTYIVAFLVSEFNEHLDGDFGVVARPEYYAQTEYALDVGPKILNVLDNYFGIKYYDMGVDKMHMAAIPDFSAGAMENWGLLTYREGGLLYDEGSTTLSAKQYIAAVVAHEQAHMWFGDLVTCDWWSYAWLNEGFARYFQYFATAKVESAMEFEAQFTVDQVQTVMNLDSTNSTNPMSDENTHSPADYSRQFNSITYNKGAAFIRMINHIIGEQNFQKSLQEYLNDNKYSNVKPEHIFTAWNRNWPAASKPYAQGIFSSYTEQVGYPVVTFNISDDRKTLDISQERFLLKQNDGSNSSLLYVVPITYTTSTDKNFASTTPTRFLEKTPNKVQVTLGEGIKWVIANIQQTGYYRVNYDQKTWEEIHKSLTATNWSSIHELNRAQIVDDLFNLARASKVNYTLALKVTEYLSTETEYAPWTAAFNGFSYLSVRLGTDLEHFSNHIRKLTDKVYNKLGFNERASDSALDIYTRAKVLAWACKYGRGDCADNSRSRFSNLQRSPVPVNVRSAVYCTSLRKGGQAEFNTLYAKFINETVATEQVLILSSLGCVKDPKLVKQYFDIIIGDTVRRQNKNSALTSLYTENNENVEPVFDLVTANFTELANALGDYSAVATVISNIASRFTKDSQLTKLREFNEKNKSKFGSSATTLEKAERTVTENLEWSEQHLPIIKKYLKGASAPTTSFTAFTLVLIAGISMFLR